MFTSDLEFTFHLGHAKVINGPARVHPSIEQTRLTDVEGENALIILHDELGVTADDHFILHPDDLRLSELGYSRGQRLQ